VTEFIDLRSDTVTQPTEAMREAIAHAVVGDDGWGEDPTVSELEAAYARIVGKEAALFVPSGVMANQIAIRVLSSPGDQVLTGEHGHVVGFELGASARNSAIQFGLLPDEFGVLRSSDVAAAIDAQRDHHLHVALLCVENTHMFAGGVPMTSAQFDDIADAAGDVAIHLDGARLFNAAVATGETPAALAARASTVMSALSKGLCAPVGSLLAGSSGFIDSARVERKRLGGAMRQAGFLAAAGLVALESMIERLRIDHDRARRLADVVALRFPESNFDPARCRTNIVAFDHSRARELIAQLSERGVHGAVLSPSRARFVTHANLNDHDIDTACQVLREFSWN
jgi:threonine aldolase